MNDQIPASNLWAKFGFEIPEKEDIKVHFSSLSSIDLSSFEHHFSALEFAPGTKEDASIFIVAVETLGDHRLAVAIKAALATGKPLLVLKWCGIEIQLALFSNESACWACFEKRHKLLDASATYAGYALPDQLPITEPLSYTETTRTFAFSWAATLTEHFLASQMNEQFAGKLYTYNLQSLRQKIYPITKLHGCLACGLSERNIFPTTPVVSFDKNMLTDSE